MFLSGSVTHDNVIKSNSSSSQSLCYFVNRSGHTSRIGSVFKRQPLEVLSSYTHQHATFLGQPELPVPRLSV